MTGPLFFVGNVVTLLLGLAYLAPNSNLALWILMSAATLVLAFTWLVLRVGFSSSADEKLIETNIEQEIALLRSMRKQDALPTQALS